MNFVLTKKKDGMTNFEEFILNDSVIAIRKFRWNGDFTLDVKYKEHFELINFTKNRKARDLVFLKLSLNPNFASKLVNPVAIKNDYYNLDGEYLGE
jgi:hypothetical protein